MEFDENNDEFMDALSTSMVTVVPHKFAAEISASGFQLSLNYEVGSRLDPHAKSRFIEMIDECMGPIYVQNKGSKWKTEKMEEFGTAGLVFVWYELKSQPVCFVSLKLCEEAYGRCLYLYEIQVLPKMQGHSLGTMLLSSFHGFSKHLDTLSNLPDLQHFQNSFTALTVFADNERALSWYKRNSYELSPDSPRDRVMRNGKVTKPEYYLLYRKATEF